MKDNKSGWQFPKALEIIKCKEGNKEFKTLGDPLLDRAVVLYAKAEFGFNDDAERYRNAYDYLKCALSLTADYTEESEGE